MLRNIPLVLNKIQDDLERQQKKLECLRENMSCLVYWEDSGDGGSWKPFTEEIALYDHEWNVDDFRVNKYYLVKTEIGVLLLTKEEYASFMGDTYVIYQGSYQACKDFIKV